MYNSLRVKDSPFTTLQRPSPQSTYIRTIQDGTEELGEGEMKGHVSPLKLTIHRVLSPSMKHFNHDEVFNT
jgi:hypothetical protein